MKPKNRKVGEILIIEGEHFRIVAITRRGMVLRCIQPPISTP